MIPTKSRLSYASGYLELGMYKEAERELQGIVVTDRINFDVLVMKTRLFMAVENWKKLLTTAKNLAERFKEESYGWVNWAYALRELDRNQEAKEVALSAVNVHKDVAVLWYNLACYCSLLGEMPDAATYLAKSKALDKDFEDEAKSDPDLAELLRWLDNKD